MYYVRTTLSSIFSNLKSVPISVILRSEEHVLPITNRPNQRQRPIPRIGRNPILRASRPVCRIIADMPRALDREHPTPRNRPQTCDVRF